CEGGKGDAGVLHVQQPVHHHAAGVHAARHFGLGNTPGFHGLGQLPGDHALHGGGHHFLAQAVLFEQVVEIAADMFVHLSPRWSSRNRLRAVSISRGARRAFLMKPCSSTMRRPLTVNSRRTMPSRMWLRISHRPCSSLRTTGMPRGQPNWTVLISVPSTLRSAVGRLQRKSRTGSVPAGVRKKWTVRISGVIALYLKRYVWQAGPFSGVRGQACPPRHGLAAGDNGKWCRRLTRESVSAAPDGATLSGRDQPR